MRRAGVTTVTMGERKVEYAFTAYLNMGYSEMRFGA